jgi:hypothetical protein
VERPRILRRSKTTVKSPWHKPKRFVTNCDEGSKTKQFSPQSRLRPYEPSIIDVRFIRAKSVPEVKFQSGLPCGVVFSTKVLIVRDLIVRGAALVLCVALGISEIFAFGENATLRMIQTQTMFIRHTATEYQRRVAEQNAKTFFKQLTPEKKAELTRSERSQDALFSGGRIARRRLRLRIRHHVTDRHDRQDQRSRSGVRRSVRNRGLFSL